MSSNIESRIKTVEEAMQALTQLAVSASERMDTHESWINILGSSAEALTARMEELAAAQTNSEVKIAALTDAQIKTEDSITKTNEALASLTVRVDHLTELVERFISEGRNGNS